MADRRPTRTADLPSPWRGTAGLLVALLAGLILLTAGVGSLQAAAGIPALTGRVVDNANLLSAQSQSAIESKLRTLEEKSGIQLVVATLPSLGGEEIEPYANRLFRAWKLGEKTKNNGVLLLVAPAEHKARIEVGYGLEGTLTDALSKLIITNAMVPRFKAKDFQGGIERGVDDIIAVLSTNSAEWQKRPDLQAAKPVDLGALGWGLVLAGFVIAFGVLVLIVWMARKYGVQGGRSGGAVFIPASGWSSTSDSGSSGSSASSGDSGFSGGGGSSGGGGASGDW